MIFDVIHAQRRFDGPDDAPVTTRIEARDDHPGVYLTAPKLGCSRTFQVPAQVAIRRWLTGEHAQTVILITEVEPT